MVNNGTHRIFTTSNKVTFKDRTALPSKKNLDRGPNGEFNTKKTKSPLKIIKGENIDISGKKLNGVYGTYGEENNHIKNGSLIIEDGKISFDKNKQEISIKIIKGELKFGKNRINIDNITFINSKKYDLLLSENNDIGFNNMCIELNDRKVIYNNGEIDIKERKKKGIKGVISRVSKKVFGIGNK